MYRNIIIVTALIFNAAAYAQYPVRFPLKISKDKRYLVDQANKPFPILGRTAWFIITQSDSGYENFFTIPLSMATIPSRWPQLCIGQWAITHRMTPMVMPPFTKAEWCRLGWGTYLHRY